MNARQRLMDLLAVRDHSEAELREKLAARFPEADVEDALAHARENGWIPEPGALARRVADRLHRKSKGLLAINHVLEGKGLPPVAGDADRELEKALRLAETKRSSEAEPDRAERERIGRFLLGRGFEPSIVRKVIYEKL